MSNLPKRFHYPTPEEIHAIEVAARRAQVREMLRLGGVAVRGVMGLVLRAVNAAGKLRRRPATIARHGA
jgi:hypothetical protein